MPRDDLIRTVGESGLSAGEAAVYCAALVLGPSSIQRIAAEAGMKRTTAYYVVQALIRHGLMSVHVHGFKRSYAAENPSQLDSILALRRERLRKALPELSALYNLQGKESYIRHYQGVPGVRSVYEQLLEEVRPGEEYLVVSNYEQWAVLDPEFLRSYRERRSKRRWKVRVLALESQLIRLAKEEFRQFGEEVRILPPDAKLDTNLIVTAHKVIILQLIPPVMALVLENRSVVAMHRSSFEIMWRSSAPMDGPDVLGI